VQDKVEKAIAKIRPALGVNIIELVDVVDGVVRVRVIPSACSAGIPRETVVTLLEEQITEDIPEIREVVAVD
jgi:Fe-S cluster biogenesis protein NfuA